MRDYRWSEAEDEQLKTLWAGSLTRAQIGARLDRSLKAVQGRAAKLKLPYRAKGNVRGNAHFWTVERVDHLKESVAKGETCTKIAMRLGCSRSAVISKTHRIGPRKRIRADVAKAPEPTRKLPFGLPPIPVIPGGTGSISPFASKPRRVPPAVTAMEAKFCPIEGVEPIRLVARPFNTCGWPVGGEGADMRACGLKTHSGSYCYEHAVRAYPALRQAPVAMAAE